MSNYEEISVRNIEMQGAGMSKSPKAAILERIFHMNTLVTIATLLQNYIALWVHSLRNPIDSCVNPLLRKTH